MAHADSTTENRAPALDWALIRRQLFGILRMELRGTLFSGRAFVAYFLAFAPVAIITIWAMTPFAREAADGPVQASSAFAYFYLVFYATSALYLSCLLIFMSLFRTEIQERTLHYYFLAPVRREVVVVAKYLAGLVAVVGSYALGTALFYLAFISPWGLDEAMRHLFSGPGFGNLVSYVSISVLACIGYGSIFLLAGMVMRNPAAVALIVWGWEGINPFLPATLKKFSVIFYLKSLAPIPVSDGPLTIFTEPTPAYLAVPGLLLFSLALLFLACLRGRRYEIRYGGDD